MCLPKLSFRNPFDSTEAICMYCEHPGGKHRRCEIGFSPNSITFTTWLYTCLKENPVSWLGYHLADSIHPDFIHTQIFLCFTPLVLVKKCKEFMEKEFAKITSLTAAGWIVLNRQPLRSHYMAISESGLLIQTWFLSKELIEAYPARLP